MFDARRVLLFVFHLHVCATLFPFALLLLSIAGVVDYIAVAPIQLLARTMALPKTLHRWALGFLLTVCVSALATNDLAALQVGCVHTTT